jgi:peptidoglycan LD-endopeptidase LytH
MKKARFARTKVGFAAGVGFLAGMLTMSVIVAIFPEPASRVIAAPGSAAAPAGAEITAHSSPQAVAAPQTAIPVMDANPIEDLRRRHLDLPLPGAKSADVQDMFNEKRGADRRHEAVDMLAARNTPVLAVEDGTVAKLFFSNAGGNTVYQFDPSKTYAYYYAHLERYADGLAEGAAVARGQVIGYVGTSGNAPPGTPHLHFAIFKLSEEKQWWKGTAIDPFQVFR